METIAERRRRKLIALAQANGGLSRLARACDVSAASLDQVIKQTLMQPKQDGTRSAKALGDASARKIEDALHLGRGWFDAEDAISQSDAPIAQPEPDALLHALNVLATAISNADELTRLSIEPLLSRLAQRPQESGTISRKLYQELSGRTISNERGETEAAGQLFDLDVRKTEQSGQRDRISAKGSKSN